MTIEEIRSVGAEWAKTFGLQGWDIEYRIVRFHEMVTPDKGAEIVYVMARHEALVKVLEPSDWDPASMRPQDHEQDVVHELVHLLLAHWDPPKDSLEHDLKEEAVCGLATSFLAVKRGRSDTTVR